jgi:hypothetical protein
MKQRDLFLSGEGDAWHLRKRVVEELADFLICLVASKVMESAARFSSNVSARKLHILEIGCGEVARLQWLRDKQDADAFGLEPSSIAVKEALVRGVGAKQCTTDNLPF